MRKIKEKKKLKELRRTVRAKWNYTINVLRDTSGISTIELLLVLVVLIALVLIFKNQLINLVNTIFDKITSESAGI